MDDASRLGSRYTLRTRIGFGGMGEVWRGDSPDGPVAIKILRSDLAGNPEVVARFVQERNILRELSSPHIVAVRDLVIEGDRLAIVMEFVPGENLRVLLGADGNLLPDRAIAITVQVLDGLTVAHARGVVHRDLKPENVLLIDHASDPFVKIVDFGIARIVGGTQLSRTSGLIGTPQYLAPEMGLGHPASPAADIYGVGIMVYEMLFGRVPFDLAPPVAVLKAHAEEPPARPPGVPDALWRQIDAMLAKDPMDRPDAAEAAARLRQLGPGVADDARFSVLASEPGAEDDPTIVATRRPESRGRGGGSRRTVPVERDRSRPPNASSSRRAWVIAPLAAVLVLAFAGLGALVLDRGGSSNAVCEDGARWQQRTTTILDGTPVVRIDPNDDGTSQAGVIEGGALLSIPDPQEGTAMGYDGKYRTLTPGEFAALDHRPRDGTLVKERGYPFEGRLFYSIAGGTFEVVEAGSLTGIGVDPARAVFVPSHGLDEAPRAPRSGTLLRVHGSDEVWVIDGGTRRLAVHLCDGARIAELPDSPGVLDAVPVAP